MISTDSDAPLSLLAEASASLIGSSSLSETLARILNLSQGLLAADAFAIWGYDADREKMSVLSSHGLPESYLADSTVEALPPGPLPELVVASLSDEPMLQPFLERYRRLGIESMLVLPLRAGAGDLGTLTLYYRTRHEFRPAEMSIGRSLANLSAAAISAAYAEEARQNTVADLQRSETGLQLLSTAGLLLNESLDYRTTLSNLTRALVPALADWCSVHVMENGEVVQIAVGHVDPSKIHWAAELQERYPSDPDAGQGIYQVIRSGRSEHMAMIPSALLEAAAIDEEHLRLIRELGLRSYICVPMQTRTGVIGALTLIYAESGRIYEDRDVELAEEFGRRAGLAVEKARLYQESERARAELERANEAKDAFLGIVAHELRSPVTTILGSAKLLASRGERLAPEDRVELSQAIADSGQRMATLIENLLILARLEVGNQPALSDFDLVPVVGDAVSELPEGERRIVIHSAESCLVHGEPTYVRQVLANLIGNAHKYSPVEEAIEVVVDCVDMEATIAVLDRGDGVHPEELNLIFDSFYRSAQTADLPGKGLGLAICKRFVEAMGGSISAHLRSGGGLEVRFSIPTSATSATSDGPN